MTSFFVLSTRFKLATFNRLLGSKRLEARFKYNFNSCERKSQYDYSIFKMSGQKLGLSGKKFGCLVHFDTNCDILCKFNYTTFSFHCQYKITTIYLQISTKYKYIVG